MNNSLLPVGSEEPLLHQNAGMAFTGAITARSPELVDKPLVSPRPSRSLFLLRISRQRLQLVLE